MIVEHAVLNVTPGNEEEFIEAVNEGLPLLAETEGFLSATISRGIESPSTFILDVEWTSVEAHTEGFRGSERFAQWKASMTHSRWWSTLPRSLTHEPRYLQAGQSSIVMTPITSSTVMTNTGIAAMRIGHVVV